MTKKCVKCGHEFKDDNNKIKNCSSCRKKQRDYQKGYQNKTYSSPFVKDEPNKKDSESMKTTKKYFKQHKAGGRFKSRGVKL